MKFHSDAHFVIGKVHERQNKPCQDHAMAVDSGAVTLSDGCSSGGQTDIGARVINCAAADMLEEIGPSDLIDSVDIQLALQLISLNSDRSRVSLNLYPIDMLATCCYAIVNSRGGYVHMIGDGCLAIKFTNGDITVVQLEWANNMPLYISYMADRQIYSFSKNHLAINEGKTALVINTYRSSTSTLLDVIEQKINITETKNGYVYPIPTELLVNIECIAVFSDGVCDMKLPVQDVIRELLDFKNFNGDFVKRRMSAALKAYERQEIYPQDDLSMAVIHVTHNKKEEHE